MLEEHQHDYKQIHSTLTHTPTHTTAHTQNAPHCLRDWRARLVWREELVENTSFRIVADVAGANDFVGRGHFMRLKEACTEVTRPHALLLALLFPRFAQSSDH